MNFQKFTQKSIEAVEAAQNLAAQNGNQQIEQEHMLLALLEQENGLARELVRKAGNEQIFFVQRFHLRK